MTRRARRGARERSRNAFEQIPWGAFAHRFAPLEVIDPDGLEAIHQASMTILETSGLRVLDPRVPGNLSPCWIRG